MPEQIKEVSENEVAPPAHKQKPNIILIAVIAVAVGAGGFFAGKMLSSKGAPEVKKEQQVSEAQKEQKSESENKAEAAETQKTETSSAIPGLLKLDEFTVNLNDPFGKRYANLSINLELKNKSFVEKIKAEELLMPKIRDTIFMILSAKAFNDLNSLAGKENLKDEIKLRLNEIFQQYLQEAEVVKEIYFDKFLLQ